jgi:hypothetical protein
MMIFRRYGGQRASHGIRPVIQLLLMQAIIPVKPTGIGFHLPLILIRLDLKKNSSQAVVKPQVRQIKNCTKKVREFEADTFLKI